MKKLIVLIVFIFFTQIVSAGELKENKKTGANPNIDWFSIQLGAGFPIELVVDLYEPPEQTFMFALPQIGIGDITFFTIKWKYGYFSPFELSTLFFVGRFGAAVRGGVRLPVDDENEFRIGSRVGVNYNLYGIMDVTPHIVFLHYYENGWHFGFGVDAPLLFFASNLNGTVHPAIYFYFKFGF